VEGLASPERLGKGLGQGVAGDVAISGKAQQGAPQTLALRSVQPLELGGGPLAHQCILHSMGTGTVHIGNVNGYLGEISFEAAVSAPGGLDGATEPA
jgi:hypothetical protein